MAGLAQEMAGAPSQEVGMGAGMPSVDEVVALLMQGIDPQQLVEQGIPPELIMEAVALLEQQMAAQAAQSSPQQGLATQSVQGM